MNPSIQAARRAAVEVLLHNATGPYEELPRTAGWGYPEPYTRDLLISALGILTTGNEVLLGSLRRVLETLARNQSPHGMMPSLVHGYRKVLGMDARAEALRIDANRSDGRGFVTEGQPVYALWFHKVLRDNHCDILGNSLAILTGMADPQRARDMIAWIESHCAAMRANGELALDLPPCLIPFVLPGDPEWHARCEIYNRPGHYHNGGVWPFVCGFYIAALVAAGEHPLAHVKLQALTSLVECSRTGAPAGLGSFGFNEWFRAQDGQPAGEDWQSWSAAMYLYAAACVQAGKPLFFRGAGLDNGNAGRPEGRGPEPAGEL